MIENTTICQRCDNAYRDNENVAYCRKYECDTVKCATWCVKASIADDCPDYAPLRPRTEAYYKALAAILDFCRGRRAEPTEKVKKAVTEYLELRAHGRDDATMIAEAIMRGVAILMHDCDAQRYHLTPRQRHRVKLALYGIAKMPY